MFHSAIRAVGLCVTRDYYSNPIPVFISALPKSSIQHVLSWRSGILWLDQSHETFHLRSSLLNELCGQERLHSNYSYCYLMHHAHEENSIRHSFKLLDTQIRPNRFIIGLWVEEREEIRALLLYPLTGK